MTAVACWNSSINTNHHYLYGLLNQPYKDPQLIVGLRNPAVQPSRPPFSCICACTFDRVWTRGPVMRS